MKARALTRTLICILLTIACGVPSVAQTKTLRIVFQPDNPQFSEAAHEYEKIWAGEGQRITAMMEAVSGLKFEDREVKAIVLEMASNSGYKEKPMHLRASYPLDTKKATLIHELGHRLESDVFHKDEDDHKYLFLWIYEVWTRLYGREFADAQVAVERKRGGPYPAAWDFALSFTPEQRAAKWKEVLTERTESQAQPQRIDLRVRPAPERNLLAFLSSVSTIRMLRSKLSTP